MPAIGEMWKNLVHLAKPQMKKLRVAEKMRFFMPGYYLTYIAFPLQKWLGERATMLRHTHIACLVSIHQTSSPLLICIVTCHKQTVCVLV
jgi:hypothetical protein